jgi:hypothetical protein
MTNALEQLKYSIQALALPADIQLSLFPDFVCKADELALDFDNWWQTVLNQEITLTSRQLVLLSKLDNLLGKMSGTSNEALWTETSLRTNENWTAVRELAQATLEAFGWSLEVPPSNKSIYIPSKAP